MGILTYILSKTAFRQIFRSVEEDHLLNAATEAADMNVTPGSLESGTLSLSDKILSYASDEYGSWGVALTEVVAFGEYTTDNGPFIDDWFVVFVTQNLEWLEASNYCRGCHEVREALRQIWAAESLHQDTLIGSTEFDSVAIWPESVRGHRLFQFTQRQQSILQRIRSFGLNPVDKDIAPTIKNMLTAK
jgi:hypothetical protein